jgi:hypothetical protein
MAFRKILFVLNRGRNNMPSFAYIAFDDCSNQILAYGQTAVDALLRADMLAPDVPIYIIKAGSSGLEIWNERMDLVAATKNLAAKPPKWPGV